MSLYTFATTNLTTSADHHRRPVVSAAQIARTLVLAALVLVALAVMARRGEAAETGFGGFVASP